MLRLQQLVGRIPRIALLAGMALIMSSACTLRKPTTLAPPASDQASLKDFFVGAAGDKNAIGNKTFLCGWAPIAETGAIGEAYLTHNVHMADHCNLQFEIHEKLLVGKMVNTSFPNDRNRWQQIITIPITKHYYYERKKDQYGRDTNEFVENSDRSDWSARPYMKLDFTGIKIHHWAYQITWTGAEVTSIEDIEWDKEKGFLGFTVTATDALLGSWQQGKFRFNFLEFQHNPGFTKTPFAEDNSRLFNTLHIMGGRIEGLHPVFHAAHWDLSKPHDVYLVGFPREYESIGREIVQMWNDTLAEIGQPKNVFHAKSGNDLKYPFDLRYPAIVWVSDMRISSNSPLGVGMAQADVRNGEILWGGITLYGGMIESYIKSYSSGDLAQGSRAAKNALAPKISAKLFDLPNALSLPPNLTPQSMQLNPNLVASHLRPLVQAKQQELIKQAREDLGKLSKGGDTNETRQLKARLESLQDGLARIDHDVAQQILASVSSLARENEREVLEQFRSETFRDRLGIPASNPPDSEAQLSTRADHRKSTANRTQQLAPHHEEAADALKAAMRGSAFDYDRTFADVAGGWMIAAADLGHRFSFPEAVRAVVKDLILHEYGHFLGLGHNFQENILPEPGRLPQKHQAQLEKMAQAKMNNFSTVMGYKHPKTDLETAYDEIKPGPHDRLVLRYLYNRQYATYRQGDEDFTFFPLPVSGRIPVKNPDNPEFKTAYFPACNDLEASLSYSPFCNRFDRGFNAETIMKTYLDDMLPSRISKLYAFADANGSDPEYAEMLHWDRALKTLGRVRLFYDFMRAKYRKEIESISNSSNDLYAFSAACSDVNAEGQNQRVAALFKKKPGLKELCKANKHAIDEMIRLLSDTGRDHTKIDFENYTVAASLTAGDAEPSYSRMWGTWQEMSVFPYKVAALNALTTPYPYMYFSGWMFPLPQYSTPGEDSKYLYSSLYPKEYTEAIAAAVGKNLRFGSTDQEGLTTMGRTALATGFFAAEGAGSNEVLKFPGSYLDTIRTQSQFRIDYVAVLLTPIERFEEKDRAVAFKSELYNLSTGRTSPGYEAYILPDGEVILRAGHKTFLYPFTKVSFLMDNLAYVIAYKIEFEQKYEDALWGNSIKAAFYETHKKVFESCVHSHNGLATFFNSQKSTKLFRGFKILPGIAQEREKHEEFLKSIQENFENYWNAAEYGATKPNARTCDEARKGIGLIVSSAAVLNGYWLPETIDYLVK